MAQWGCQIRFFHIPVISSDFVWLHHSFGQCTKRGFLHLRCDHRQKPSAALPFPELSSAFHGHCWMLWWLQSCPRSTVCSGWVSSGAHSPPPSCRSCSCSQGHFRSSFSLQTCSLSRQPRGFLWQTSASRSPCKEQRHLGGAWHCTELRKAVLRLQLSFGLASASHQGIIVHHLLQHHLFVFSDCKQAKATNIFSLWD